MEGGREGKGRVACLRLERATISLPNTGTFLMGKRGDHLATRKIILHNRKS